MTRGADIFLWITVWELYNTILLKNTVSRKRVQDFKKNKDQLLR